MHVRESKNPWLAAVLNFIIPGVGYLYVGRRTEFAVILLAGWIISLGVSGSAFAGASTFDAGLIALSELLMMMAFAYDGYMSAKEK